MHQLGLRRTIRPADLTGHALIAGNPDTLERTRVEQVLRTHGVLEQVRIVLETASTTVAWAYVRAGIGITLRPLSATLFRQPPPGLYLRCARSAFGSARLVLVRRAGVCELPAAAEFRAAAHRILV